MERHPTRRKTAQGPTDWTAGHHPHLRHHVFLRCANISANHVCLALMMSNWCVSLGAGAGRYMVPNPRPGTGMVPSAALTAGTSRVAAIVNPNYKPIAPLPRPAPAPAATSTAITVPAPAATTPPATVAVTAPVPTAASSSAASSSSSASPLAPVSPGKAAATTTTTPPPQQTMSMAEFQLKAKAALHEAEASLKNLREMVKRDQERDKEDAEEDKDHK
jgi:hypothetical protein